jgi:hypothetical protein
MKRAQQPGFRLNALSLLVIFSSRPKPLLGMVSGFHGFGRT